MKYEYDETALELMAKEHNIKLPGSAVLLIVEMLRDDHRATELVIKLKEELGEETIQDELSLRCNETIGAYLIEAIEKIFGEKFLNAYIDSHDPVPTSPGSNTVN